MNVVSAIRRAVRARVFHPIAGRLLDRALRWVRDQDGWERIASAAAYAAIEGSTGGAVGLRTALAEVIRVVGPYLAPDSIAVLRLMDEIAQEHSPEAN